MVAGEVKNLAADAGMQQTILEISLIPFSEAVRRHRQQPIFPHEIALASSVNKTIESLNNMVIGASEVTRIWVRLLGN